ncbi:TerB family tellurite resistance protein [Rheinheimera sp. MMS21-TC3]|uniref:tellurite resistance TerB family protein n=1 Tax=Rheinheimera sp. MMS21-TC3 TaxID=3072790 RepID=UPI0028C4968A|nr:TerB family tellurite resistance protein [Rheinheimera sp. MMS21-TC3]WNO62128.1 TerB family tellurite resistance protein [Rheinheimera sp. MMS21-TC3]
MLQLFKTLLDNLNPTDSNAQHQPSTVCGLSSEQFASVSLMLMVANADFNLTVEETALVEQYLQRELGLTNVEAKEVCEQAIKRADEAVSLHEFTTQLKQLSYATRLQLMQQLWQQAYIDHELDPNEEAMLRKIADLLFIRHSDYIQAKLRVIDN